MKSGGKSMRWQRWQQAEVVTDPVQKVLERVQDFGAAKAAVVVVAATVQAVLADLFGGMLVILVAAAVFDTLYGRRVAHILEDFDPLEASKGLHSKIIGILLACSVRWFEWWFAQQAVFGGFNTEGMLATGIAALLFAAEIESINRHRVRFGRGPVPLIGTFLEWVRTTAERLGARPQNGELKRRKDDKKP